MHHSVADLSLAGGGGATFFKSIRRFVAQIFFIITLPSYPYDCKRVKKRATSSKVGRKTLRN